jgi:DNA (cytosine-5)-methyltransferase 1
MFIQSAGGSMRFLDLFAGIGGFRLALEQAGHKCVGFCEIDKFARQTYKANFDTEGEVEWHDITTVTDEDVRQLGSVDIITGGFPCQAFSVAGKRGGFDDTRGTLFFEIARIARILRPRYLLLENVKGLLNHAGGETFHTILNTLAELGYWWEYQVLNSKDFGVPQNRERVFIIGHSRRFPRREIFPITGTNGQTLKELTRSLADAYRVYDPTGIARTLKAEAGGMGAKTGLYAVRSLGNIYPSGGQNGEVYDPKGLSPTLRSGQGVKGRGVGSSNSPKIAVPVLTPDRLEKRQNGRRFKEPGEPMFTLTSQDRHGVLVRHTKDGFHLARSDEKKSSIQGTHVTYPQGKSHCLGTSHVPMTIEKPSHIPGLEDINNTVRSGGRGSLTAKHNHDTIHDGVRIRRLTPLETFRLQGFPDSHHDKAKAAGVSDSQLYKQAGNAVTVTVVYEIAKRLG